MHYSVSYKYFEYCERISDIGDVEEEKVQAVIEQSTFSDVSDTKNVSSDARYKHN